MMPDLPGFTGDGQPSQRLDLLRRGLIGPWRETYDNNREFQALVDELAYTMARAADLMALGGDAIRRGSLHPDPADDPVHVVIVDRAEQIADGVRVVELGPDTLVRPRRHRQ
jgi:hypothetical protein